MDARRGLIIEVIYAPLIGGSETLAFTLCQQWKHEGIQTRIACLQERTGAMTAKFEEAGLAYDLLDLGGQPVWRRVVRLARYFIKWRPRAIHVHHFGSLVNVLPAAWLAGCFNVVYTEHSAYHIARTRWMQRVLPIFSYCVRKVTCVSNRLVEFLGDELGVPTRKLVTVYNGVDTRRFRPARRAEKTPREVLRIGAVGRLVEEKDYPTLLQAFALLKERGVPFEGVIVGDGPLAPQLKEQAQALGLDNVQFLGRREDVPEIMRELDIYVLASKSEGMPIAVLEAMATALPIVSTAVDAVPEVIVHDVNGILVEKGNPAALAAGLERALSDPELRRRLGQVALTDVRALFSIENTTQLYAEYLGISP